MEYTHKELEKMAQEYLISIGYINTELEYKIKIGNRTYIIDVYGERERNTNNLDKPETIAIECGGIDSTKLAIISTQFDKVIIWGTNVETRKNEYAKRILKLSTKLTKYKKALETEKKFRRELENKLRGITYKEERKISLYTTIIQICLHELVGEPKFQNKSIEGQMGRLVRAFHLAYKMLRLEDNDYKMIIGEKNVELQELQDRFEELLPEIEKERI